VRVGCGWQTNLGGSGIVLHLFRHLASEEIVGTVRPKLSAAIAAKISGTIEQMLAVPGQSVKAPWMPSWA